MIEEYRRCHHCRIVYNFFVTGCRSWEDDKYNDGQYCPTCKRAIVEALDKVPRQVDSVWIPSDVTKAEIEAELERMDREDEEAAKKGQLRFREITMPLFDMVDPDNHNIHGIVRIGRKILQYSWWTKNDKVEITQKMEKNLITGEMVPWVDYVSRY